MNPITIGILGSVLLLLLLFTGMPIAFLMMLVGFLGIGYLASFGAALPVVANTVYETASYYPYTIIPLFILMGSFAGSAGITAKLYQSFDKWFRRLPGGLGIATIAACACFAALSGSSVAAAAAMGTIAIPEMRKFKYEPALAVGIVAAGGTLSFLIPPSLGFVVYGMLTEQSIGKLLVAGILPGVVLSLAFIAVIVTEVKLDPDLAPATPGRVSWGEKVRALGGVWETLLVFCIVMGGIYFGFVNPTEAGAIGAMALFVIAISKRKLDLEKPHHGATGGRQDFHPGPLSGCRGECLQLFSCALDHPHHGLVVAGRPWGVPVYHPGHNRNHLSDPRLLPRLHLHDGADHARHLSRDQDPGV